MSRFCSDQINDTIDCNEPCAAFFLPSAVKPQLTANADISGVGMIIGFASTAFLAFLLLLFHYILVYDPEKILIYDTKTDKIFYEASRIRNPVDIGLLRWTRKRVVSQSLIWKPAIEKLVLIMSDQQMLTGIALIASGWSQLPGCLSAYHWQMLIYLVCYASFTHMGTLTVLRDHFQNAMPLRWWRLICMLIIVVGIIAGLIPIGRDTWLDECSYGVPARCYFTRKFSTNSAPTSTVIIVLILMISFITRAVRLFKTISKGLQTWLRVYPSDKVRLVLDYLYDNMSRAGKSRWDFSIPYWTLLTMSFVMEAILDALESVLFEVMSLLVALIWVTLRLNSTKERVFSGSFYEDTGANLSDERKWGFGQFLTMLMLGLLAFAALEAFYEIRVARIKHQHTYSEVNSSLEGLAGASSSEIIGVSAPTVGDDAESTFSTIPAQDTDFVNIPLPQYGNPNSIDSGSCTSADLSPHRISLDKYEWSTGLYILIFGQGLAASVFLWYSGLMIVSSQYVVVLIESLLLWATFSVPVTTVIYTACCLFPKVTEHWKRRGPKLVHTPISGKVLFVFQLFGVLILCLLSSMMLFIESIWSADDCPYLYDLKGGENLYNCYRLYYLYGLYGLFVLLAVPWATILYVKKRKSRQGHV